MSVVEYIDLCENDVNKKKPMPIIQNVNGLQANKSKLQIRPKTQALKAIGISLIRMQYGDKAVKQNSNISSLNSDWKQVSLKNVLGSSLWSDNEDKSNSSKLFRHMLEETFEKCYQCPRFSNCFCYYKKKMTRINWINHIRRGHLRIKSDWKRILKNNPQTGISMVFEIFCVLCSKNVNVKPLTPKDFILHIKESHEHLMPYTEYFAFCQRCNVCNDKSKSFQQNLFHRKNCYFAIKKDPNGPFTGNFNHCFRNQRNKTIVCLEFEDDKKTFQCKWKTCKVTCHSAFNYWSVRKNHFIKKSSKVSPTKSINYYAPIRKPKIFMESDWIAPRSQVNYSDPKTKFLIPAPFLLRNEGNSKKYFEEWSKSIRPENSTLTKINPWFCEMCNGMLKNVFRAYPHLKMCHPNAIFCENQCKSCEKRFITLQGFQRHFEEFKRCPVSKKCGLCGLSVSTNDIYNHLYEKHRDQFDNVLKLGSCLICREMITDLFKHLFDIHGISDPLLTKKSVESDQLTFRNGVFFNCPQCSFTFFSEIDLRNHMITSKHHYQCSSCVDKKFYMQWEYMHHKYSHHNNTIDLTCELCPETTSTSTLSSAVTMNSSANGDHVAGDINECVLQKTNGLRWARPSDKVQHFLEVHNSQCRVVLTRLENYTNQT